MKKIVVSLLLVGSFNAHAGEMVAPNVELVSKELFVTEGATGYVEDSKEPNVFFSSATVGAHVNSVYGHVYQNISMRASHSFSMTNTENINKTYRITLRLCANGYCTTESRTYTLYGKGSYNSSADTYLTSSFTHVGTYDLIAKTEMSGDAGSSYESRASVYVTK